MALFVVTSETMLDFVASDDPDARWPDAQALREEGRTRLLPASLAASVEGCTIFRIRSLSAVERVETSALEGEEQNAATCRAALLAIDGDADRARAFRADLQPRLAFVVAEAIWALTLDPAAFARPTRPSA